MYRSGIIPEHTCALGFVKLAIIKIERKRVRGREGVDHDLFQAFIHLKLQRELRQRTKGGTLFSSSSLTYTKEQKRKRRREKLDYREYLNRYTLNCTCDSSARQ